jgi:hypothetical protein
MLKTKFVLWQILLYVNMYACTSRGVIKIRHMLYVHQSTYILVQTIEKAKQMFGWLEKRPTARGVSGIHVPFCRHPLAC